MEWTLTYIVSQVFTIIMYALLGLTYLQKDRKKVIIICFLSIMANMVAYTLLHAWSGLSMCCLGAFRNIVFLIDEKKNGKRDKNNTLDVIFLIELFIMAGILAIFTYDGFLSLLSIFATMLYTYSVWQKKTKVYKLLGIPTCMLWILYNIYIKSLFGIILESTLLICSITGYVLESKKKQKVNASIEENK